MPTLGNVLTLLDHAKRLDPDGKVARIVEMLSATNEILADMLWMEGNLETGNRTVLRTTLPTVEFRLLNQGVTPSKSTTITVDETCSLLEAWSEVDVELAKLGGDVEGFRLSEAQAFLEAMSQKMATTIFYGDKSTNPEQFDGLATRYATSTGATGQNVIKATADDGDTDCTSVYLVVWGANTVHGIFPKGSQAGLQHEDLGKVTVETTAGIGQARMRAYQDHFTWACGLSVRDWRYVVRVANVDISSLQSASPLDLADNLIKAIHRIPNLSAGRAAFYMNRSALQYLDIQRRNDVQVGGQLSYSNVDGVPVLNFRGIPVRKCDALLDTEADVA